MEKKKNILKKSKLSPLDRQEIDQLDEEITVECTDREFEKLSKFIGVLENDSGVTNVTNILRQFKKAYIDVYGNTASEIFRVELRFFNLNFGFLS